MIDLFTAKSQLREWAAGTLREASDRLGAALLVSPASGSRGAADIRDPASPGVADEQRAPRRRGRRRECAGAGHCGGAGHVVVPPDVRLGQLRPRRFARPGTRHRQGDAASWCPDWLHPSAASVDGDVAAELECRREESVDGDPFLPRVDPDIDRYRTPGQRAAVRSAMVLPPGGTLLVNLPTGAGKTLAMLAPALTAPPGSTSIIVVPTVALAMDHERRHAGLNPAGPRTAYHGGLAPAEDERSASGSTKACSRLYSRAPRPSCRHWLGR